jgi:hypothetical protein
MVLRWVKSRPREYPSNDKPANTKLDLERQVIFDSGKRDGCQPFTTVLRRYPFFPLNPGNVSRTLRFDRVETVRC